jgi:hypothetical protein
MNGPEYISEYLFLNRHFNLIELLALVLNKKENPSEVEN